MYATRSNLLIGALVVMMVPGCCCRKGCIDMASEAIKLQGFSPEEADSVIVVTRLNVDGVPLADTSLSFGLEDSWFKAPDLSLYVPDLGNSLLQREIIFPRIGRTYHIDGIELDLEVCNPCFIPGGTDHYHTMAKHRVDGEWRTGVITLIR
jgi:hypothetical protein